MLNGTTVISDLYSQRGNESYLNIDANFATLRSKVKSYRDSSMLQKRSDSGLINSNPNMYKVMKIRKVENILDFNYHIGGNKLHELAFERYLEVYICQTCH